MKQTAVEWYFDKIKSHFEHDGDLFETSSFTYAIAKQKEKEHILEFAKIVADHWGMTTVPIESIEKLYNKTYK